MKRILPLLLLLVFATTASGEGVYFNRARGFLFPGFPPEVPFILRADTAGQAAPSLPLNLGDDDFTLSLIFDNLRDTPDRDYRYSDADGKRRKAIMPGFTLILEDAGGQRFTTNWGYKVTELPVGDTRAAETRLTVTAPGMNPSSFNIGKNKKRNRLALCRRGDNMRIEAGSDKTADGLTVPLPVGFAPVHLSIVPDGGAEFAFFNLALTCDTPEEPPQMPVPEISQRIILSSDSRAGYWAQAGFTVDNNFIVNGGDYVVAIVPLPGGEYTLRYMKGARVHAGYWKRGMEKCHLTPRADDVYSARWLCPDGRDADPLATAIFQDGNLVITFPSLHGATITLRPHRAYTPAPVPDTEYEE